MKIRLSKKDVELLIFLARYKIMYAASAEKVYQSKWYYLKRLKVLENAGYIKRYKRFYIKLDKNGAKLIKELGYENNKICRKKEYQLRVKDIAQIAIISINSNIRFMPSWQIKDNKIFTETARKFVGELEGKEGRYIVYYISRNKEYVYIKQVVNDIQKAIEYKKVMVFVEDYEKVVKKKYQYFITGKESTKIIKFSKENLDKIVLLETIDLYDVLLKIYRNRGIMLSDWKNADYVTNMEEYIVLMPFIDVERLHRLNVFFKSCRENEKIVNIITLKENISKINEILIKQTTIIEIDKELLGGKNENIT